MHETLSERLAPPARTPTPAATRFDLASTTTGSDRLLLVGHVGEQAFALPAASVERVVRMAALTPLPDAPAGIVGMLNLGGTALPVVDPRHRLGRPSPEVHPDQRLIVLRARTRYLLWVDEVERIVSVQPRDLDAVQSDAEQPLAPSVVRLDGEVIPVLSPEALDPSGTQHPNGRAR
jgi:purine-binding chemotaxis protein CheW